MTPEQLQALREGKPLPPDPPPARRPRARGRPTVGMIGRGFTLEQLRELAKEQDGEE